MEREKEPSKEHRRIYVKKRELLFVGAEYADNLSGIEVYLNHNNDHIGAIHYSRHTRKYSYHPDATKFICYSPDMLETITSIIERADNNKKKEP